jgi:hypothetical protein
VHQQIAKLLKLNSFSQLASAAKNDQLRPLVYISSVDNYQNVTPWLTCGARIEALALDKDGTSILTEQFVKSASKNYLSPIHLVSIPALQPASFAKLNLKKLAETLSALNEELRQLHITDQ